MYVCIYIYICMYIYIYIYIYSLRAPDLQQSDRGRLLDATTSLGLGEGEQGLAITIIIIINSIITMCTHICI